MIEIYNANIGYQFAFEALVCVLVGGWVVGGLMAELLEIYRGGAR